MDNTHKVEYKIRDLSTRSVVLFPTRAQVTREIKNVPLRSGANEITIFGLSPTVDEHSIKVEGIGSATISDIAVESLPNREIFEDIYPDSDLERSIDSDSEEDEQSEPEDKPELSTIKKKLIELRDDLKRAKEAVANADNRLKILDAYGKTLDRKRNVVIEQSLEVYKQEREKAFEDHMTGASAERRISHAISEANKEQARLLKLDKKEKAKANKEKARIQKTRAKELMKRAKREEERIKEKQRIFKERQSFWPRYCYAVRIQLDVNNFTPAPSRRGSVSSEIDVVHRSPSKTMDIEETPHCDLVLSYVTASAYWSPSYDLQLSTTNATASLCFDARLNNSTSESWENCKITLSTSQTTFTGIEDSTPILLPWRIKLAPKNAGAKENDILNSREEKSQRNAFTNKQKNFVSQKPRTEMFGVGPTPSGGHALSDYQMQLMLLEQQNKKRLMMARQEDANPEIQQRQRLVAQAQVQQQQMQQQAQQSMQPQGRSMNVNPFSAPPPVGGGLFGMSAQPQAAVNPAMMSNAGFSAWQGETMAFGGIAAEEPFGLDVDTLMEEPEPQLDFQESLIEETGLTTTYDLPGLKTLVPKSTASKQRVARINFTNVFFSHTIVAKYHPTAYLKAKLKNNSKLTLLKGPASLTLDGSFMGRTNLPRCSAGDTFSLSLGVDPAIKVIYPKPEVRRSTTGMFNKENSSVYVRTVTVQNSRASAGKAVNLLVLDQIPVSEDERLRVELIKPQSLTLGGSGAPAGAPGRESKEDKDWGKATAFLKKGGQVAWEVKLNAGNAVKLALEYSIAMPSGDHAEQC